MISFACIFQLLVFFTVTASILKYFEFNKMQNWSQRQFPRQMNHDYDCQDSGFAATVAATALAIYSLEEQEAENQRRMKEELEMSKIRNGARQVDLTTGSRRVTRRLSSMEINDAGNC
uniref:Uncharacterized protein n=1 Tax=Rhizophora mucronata TaxID=61149 RepID=A0A2P2IW32_RHIMU